MRYDKIIEYANSKSLVVSESPNSGLKMNYEVGDVHINLFVQPKNSTETWFAGYIHYAKYDKGKKYEFEIPKAIRTEEEIIKLIEVSTTVANKLNVVNEQLASIKQLTKELTN
jgi:hypothetical protein